MPLKLAHALLYTGQQHTKRCPGFKGFVSQWADTPTTGFNPRVCWIAELRLGIIAVDQPADSAKYGAFFAATSAGLR